MKFLNSVVFDELCSFVNSPFLYIDVTSSGAYSCTGSTIFILGHGAQMNLESIRKRELSRLEYNNLYTGAINDLRSEAGSIIFISLFM